jgi:hypothetical protein
MGLHYGTPGTTFLTADTDVGGGRPVRVFSVHEIYGAGATGSVLRNGTDATGDAYVQLDATDSTGITTNFSEGTLFPNGLFFDEGTSVTSILISFHIEA